MTSISSGGINQQAPIDYTPIDIDRVKPQMAAKVQELQNDFLARIDDLKAQIADDPRSARSLELKGEITRLENAFRDFSDKVVQHHYKRGELTVVHEDSHRAPLAKVQGQVREMQMELRASYEAYGTAAQGSGQTGGVDSQGMLEMKPPMAYDIQATDAHRSETVRLWEARHGSNDGGVGAPDASNTTHSPDAIEGPKDSETTSETKAGGKTAADFEVQEMVNLLSSDPDAFMKELSAIEDPGERASLMTLVQSQLQQINQLFSMVSQFSQAMHDTSKAIISNLRV